MPLRADMSVMLPELRAAEAKLRQLAGAAGLSYVFADYGGFRDEPDTARILRYRSDDYAAARKSAQAKLAAGKGSALTTEERGALSLPIEQWRPISPFGSSKHNWGGAFDVRMTRGLLSQLGALAPRAGLVWGGTFSKERRDVSHFELPATTVELRARFLKLYPSGAPTTGATPVVLFLLAGLGALLARFAGGAAWRA